MPYYTFSDFFVQAADEMPLEGISIGYQILYNRWKPTPYAPDGVGALWQERKKRRRGRWNNYDRRVWRPVIYMGIDRLVPHAEKSTSKNYRMLFRHAQTTGWEDELCQLKHFLRRSFVRPHYFYRKSRLAKRLSRAVQEFRNPCAHLETIDISSLDAIRRELFGEGSYVGMLPTMLRCLETTSPRKH